MPFRDLCLITEVLARGSSLERLTFVLAFWASGSVTKPSRSNARAFNLPSASTRWDSRTASEFSVGAAIELVTSVTAARRENLMVAEWGIEC